MIRLADCCAPSAKPFALSSRWVEAMEAEAFEQGDVCKERGEKVPTLMDRTRPQRATKSSLVPAQV